MSEPKWTPAQRAAIEDRGGALLVSAAAGSGCRYWPYAAASASESTSARISRLERVTVTVDS